jgi:hypothetical protein
VNRRLMRRLVRKDSLVRVWEENEDLASLWLCYFDERGSQANSCVAQLFGQQLSDARISGNPKGYKCKNLDLIGQVVSEHMLGDRQVSTQSRHTLLLT